jgi:hypothetical protein
MPMLADLDDPPPSRARGLLLGLVIATLVTAGLALWLLPGIVQVVLGGARDLDARLREQDAYMFELCTTALSPEPDDKLCGCVLATEYPAIDCQHFFQRWLLAQQSLRCSDEATNRTAMSFCACVEAVAQATEEAADEDQARREAQAYERCLALPDRLDRPEIVRDPAPPS